MLIILRIVISVSTAQIAIIILIDLYIKLFASLTAFFHSIVYEVLYIFLLVCSKHLLQICIMCSIIIVIIDCSVLLFQCRRCLCINRDPTAKQNDCQHHKNGCCAFMIFYTLPFHYCSSFSTFVDSFL